MQPPGGLPWPNHLSLACHPAPAVDELKDVAKSLRRLPVVEPELPTVRRTCSPPPAVLPLRCLLNAPLHAQELRCLHL